MKAKIGLEIHVHLNSKSKIFCGCRNPANLKEEPEPNTFTCPTCLGFPGAKPAVNREVIRMGIKAALALHSEVAGEMFFSRKVYFYPDLSKDFQITQFEVPLGTGGWLKSGGKKIRLKRMHIEEDAARVVHIGGMVGGRYTLIDYNRAGQPHLEIVTEPDFSSAEEARAFIQKLSTVLEYLGIYDSSTRAVIKTDANVSVGGGNRVEVKEITGAKEIETAIKYEINRQEKLLRGKGKVSREVRAWDSEKGITQTVRSKEVEEEYGYIFEPDLTRIENKKGDIKELEKELPELPEEKAKRLKKKYRLKEKVVESLVSEMELADLFELAAKHVKPKTAATWITGYLKKSLNYLGLRYRESGLEDMWVVSLLRMFEDGKLTDRNAEMVIRKMLEDREPPEKVAKKYRLEKEEIDIDSVVDKVLKGNEQAIEDFKKGEEKAVHYLVGQCMKETRGQVGAVELRNAIKKALGKLV